MIGKFKCGIAAAFLSSVGAVAAGPAAAHPHVWVDAVADLGIREGALQEVRMRWTFDDFFSLVLFEDFDVNDNKRFEPNEVEKMRDGAFTGLGEVAFFTDLRIDGVRVDWSGARDFGVELGEDGRASYLFTLDLPQPVDPVAHKVSVTLYDPDYYVDVQFAETGGVSFTDLDPSLECGARYEPAEDTPIYFGSVIPKRAVVECWRLGS
ncbi:DUF1007 family protein [Rhodospirillaceae bacterium KN72]|uniref:DUF1007 family protein n=1 Tax=Pacificispira spongiicola TaxID=2729598 RepID=A0A7Y0E2U9_9PROT|nr:DUF1007 family protein [Pacificispira spongiicola]NMM46227.1 DUF1007 family protein [Pacificispira spongiicola]